MNQFMETPSENVEKKTPKLISSATLASLGYTVTGRGIENRAQQLRIMEVEHSDSGALADFSYCRQIHKDIGFILEHPMEFYKDRITLRGRDCD